MNKYYKIIINVPNHKDAVEIGISEEELKKLDPILNSKKIIQIGDDYINTAYIVMITLDSEYMMREKVRIQKEAEYSRIAEKTETRNPEEIKAGLKRMREEFDKKFKI